VSAVTTPSAPRWVHRQTLPTVPEEVLGAPRPRDAELPTGHLVPQAKSYEIVDQIGEGGMGKVYRAYDPSMDRYVALKVLKPEVPDSFRRRFRHEAVIAADFSHPNLTRVLDVGHVEETGLEWMTMEYLRGRDLGHVVDARRRVALPLLVDIFSQALDALEYIHMRRIVHCDVKPDNIFVTRDPYNRRIVIVKLIDFGICRSLQPPIELQRELSGDPRYMSPEQTVLNGYIDERADLYALGLTLYEVLTGRHAFEEFLDASAPKLLQIQCEVDPSPPSRYLDPATPPAVVAALDEIVMCSTCKEPEGRYANAVAMKKAVAGLLDVT
jgi:serine/threonine-protein kinase